MNLLSPGMTGLKKTLFEADDRDDKEIEASSESFELTGNWDTLLAASWRLADAVSCPPLLHLTNHKAYRILRMKTYSTVEVAKLLGIGNDTLHRWIHTKKVPAPQLQIVGGLSIRLWSKADIQKVREYKDEHYWGKGRRRRRSMK